MSWYGAKLAAIVSGRVRAIAKVIWGELDALR